MAQIKQRFDDESFWNASGIIVSTSMAKMAPAATAVVAAITPGGKAWKIEYPASDASPESAAMPPHTPKM